MLNLLRNFFSSVVAFFLIPSLLIFLFLNNFSNVFLNEATFLETLKENKTYEALATEILPSTIINLTSAEQPGQGIPSEVVSSVIATIDKERLAEDLERVVGETYKYTVGASSSLEARVDLTAYTQTLKQGLKPAIVKYYEALPACTPKQELALQGTESPTLDCRLQSKSTEEVLQEFEVDKLISDLTATAPNSLIITKNKIVFDPPLSLTTDNPEPTGKNQEGPSLEHLRNLFVALKNSAGYLLLVSGILAILLTISRLFNFAGVFRWLAWTLVSASTIPLIAASVFFFLF